MQLGTTHKEQDKNRQSYTMAFTQVLTTIVTIGFVISVDIKHQS